MASNTNVTLSQIGLLDNLKTADKSSLVAAINELKNSIDNLKHAYLSAQSYIRYGTETNSVGLREFTMPGNGICMWSAYNIGEAPNQYENIRGLCRLYVNKVQKINYDAEPNLFRYARSTYMNNVSTRWFNVSKGDIIGCETTVTSSKGGVAVNIMMCDLVWFE